MDDKDTVSRINSVADQTRLNDDDDDDDDDYAPGNWPRGGGRPRTCLSMLGG